MPLTEIAPGLRRWTAWHEEWREDVGCVAVETDDGLVLIDPLDPPRGLGRPDHALVTVFFHARSTKARHVWANEQLVRRLASRGVEVNSPFAVGDPLPGGIQAFQTARTDEVIYWLPRQRAIVVGDVLLGAGAKPRARDEPLRLLPGALARRRSDARRPPHVACAAARAARLTCVGLPRRARAALRRPRTRRGPGRLGSASCSTESSSPTGGRSPSA